MAVLRWACGLLATWAALELAPVAVAGRRESLREGAWSGPKRGELKAGDGKLSATKESSSSVAASEAEAEAEAAALAFLSAASEATTSDGKARWHPQQRCKACKAVLDYQYAMEITDSHGSTLVGLLVWTGSLIWFLGTTAQHFFVPALLYWARRLRMTPEVAGATLLALGNGAPDIFAECQAALADDLPLALSEVLGANMFVLTVAGGTVLLAGRHYAEKGGKTMEALPAEALWETFMAYFIALSCHAATLYAGRVTMFRALCLPLIYVLYVIFLVARRRGKDDLELEPALDVSSGLVGLSPPGPKDRTAFSMALWAVQWPAYGIRWVTIPPADGLWDRRRRAVSALAPLGLLGMLFATGWTSPTLFNITSCNIRVWAVLLMLTIFLGALIVRCSGEGPEPPAFYPCLTLVAKISSVIWLSLAAAELTAVVETLGLWFHVPSVRLGFTAIAWGNVASDFMSCLALASQGQTKIAFTAVLASPLFDNLMGYGVALFISAKTNGGEVPSPLSLPIVVAFGCIVASVGLLLLVMCTRDEASMRRWPWVLYTTYAVFVLLIYATTR